MIRAEAYYDYSFQLGNEELLCLEAAPWMRLYSVAQILLHDPIGHCHPL